MKIKAVIFDLDGTLVNSLADLAASVNFAIGRFGYPAKPVENYEVYAGNGVYAMIARALQPAVVSDAFLKIMRNEFFNHYKNNCTNKTTAYNGITELVNELKNRGIKVGCVTNKIDTVAKKVVNHYFGNIDIVCGQVDGMPNKPDPFSTNKVISTFGVKPEECLFVGDSCVDMQTANNSNTVSVGVLWGFRNKEELLSNGAKHIVNTPEEILELL